MNEGRLGEIISLNEAIRDEGYVRSNLLGQIKNLEALVADSERRIKDFEWERDNLRGAL